MDEPRRPNAVVLQCTTTQDGDDVVTFILIRMYHRDPFPGFVFVRGQYDLPRETRVYAQKEDGQWVIALFNDDGSIQPSLPLFPVNRVNDALSRNQKEEGT